MTTICFTLDDVIRAKTAQFGKIYKKYIDNSIDLDNIDIESGDLCEIFFNGDEKEYKKFLYEDYPFEIFAEARTTSSYVDKEFILWHRKMTEDEDMEEDINIILANPYEFNASIGNTYFFLSKIATRVREIYLPSDSITIWDKCDVLVTADRSLLMQKPEGKISIKIDMPYNHDVEADISYSELDEMLKDVEIIEKIMSLKNKNDERK